MSTQLLPTGSPPPTLDLHDIDVVVDPSVWTQLSPSMADMLQVVLDGGHEVARQNALTLKRAVVRLDLTDSNVAERQVVVSFWVHAGMKQAFEYLDEVDRRVQGLLASLGQGFADTYLARVTLQAQWL